MSKCENLLQNAAPTRLGLRKKDMQQALKNEVFLNDLQTLVRASDTTSPHNVYSTMNRSKIPEWYYIINFYPAWPGMKTPDL